MMRCGRAAVAAARIWIIPACVAAAGAVAQPWDARAQGGAELEPIRCWWRADRAAVVIGERFAVVLTCGVIDAGSITAMPKHERLDPEALQLTPFEVVDGQRFADIVAPPWRYFQYRYTLRLLGSEGFGQDFDIPSILVAYSLVSNAGETDGREQAYVLPPLSVRLLSLVPRQAADVRDGTRETFGDIEAHRLRANGELAASAISFGFAAVLLGAGVARTVRTRRKAESTAVPEVPTAVVLGECLNTIRRLQADTAAGGWTRERIVVALAALRVAAATLLGWPIAQSPMAGKEGVREGQIVVRHGVLRRRRTLVSAATGALAIARAVTAVPEADRDRRPDAVAQIGDALRTFEGARYGRSESLDGPALDAALEQARIAVGSRRRRLVWGRRVAGTVAGRFRGGDAP